MTSPLSYLVGQPLTWVPTAAFQSRYDLVAPDGSVLATLEMSNWTYKAHASVPEGRIFLKQEGWSGRKVVLSLGENGPLLATIQRPWRGPSGQLVFENGRTFRWTKLNFWGTQKAWTDPTSNTTSIQFSSPGFSRKLAAQIHPVAAEIPELSSLLVLGLYVSLVEGSELAAAAAVAVAVAVAGTSGVHL